MTNEKLVLPDHPCPYLLHAASLTQRTHHLGLQTTHPLGVINLTSYHYPNFLSSSTDLDSIHLTEQLDLNVLDLLHGLANILVGEAEPEPVLPGGR